jgi:hypothetical protein
VDTSSILAKGITPSAVHKGVNSGLDDTLSKYRISNTEADAENIDWRKTIKNASRAAVDEPDEVMAKRSSEPTVHISNQQNYKPPANTGPLPSEQLRREDVFRPPPQSNSPISRPPPSQSLTSPKSGNVPPPPGPSRTVYSPPPQQHRSVGVTVVNESTIRPSLLKDTSDPFEKYRIHDPPAATDKTNPENPAVSATSPKNDTPDPLQKYRVKTAEEEDVTWHFFLTALPADPGKPVELKCDGEVVFLNEGVNGMVNTHANYLATGDSTDVVLVINSIPFTLNKALEISKGRFVRFVIEKGRFVFRQQKTDD